MELLDSTGRELVWGLLAFQQRFVSRDALLAAIDAWHDAPERPLSQILLDERSIDPRQASRLNSALRNITDRQDSDPIRILGAIALEDAIEDVLGQISDLEWQSHLRQALRAVGIEAGFDSGLTTSDASECSASLSATDDNGDHGGTVGLNEIGPVVRAEGDSLSTLPSNQAGSPVKLPATNREPEESTGQPSDRSDTENCGDGGSGDETTSRPAGDGAGPAQAPSGGTNFLPMRYRILRPHAQGGLGAVFVAHDEELHREVALKEILERHVYSTENRIRFLLEAEVTGGLEHPGIVPVYGLGQYDDGRPYYAMRFIRGESLKSAITQFHLGDKQDRDPGELRPRPAPAADPFRGRLRGHRLRPQPGGAPP